MSRAWSDRESLDAAEPRAAEEPVCPLCGTRVSHPLEPGGTVLCHPDRGGCGVTIRPVPYLVTGKHEAVPVVVTHWEGCCTPYTPVGDKLTHSRWCEAHPNEALTPNERDEYRAALRAAYARSVREHPAGSEVRAWKPWWRDPAYVDAHVDDEDDRPPIS